MTGQQPALATYCGMIKDGVCVQESRKLQVLVLEDAQLTDAHVTPLARIMRSASQSQLEHLSMASNRFARPAVSTVCSVHHLLRNVAPLWNEQHICCDNSTFALRCHCLQAVAGRWHAALQRVLRSAVRFAR